VASLPPKQRLAVVHRHVLDRSYADVADLMGTSEEAARANVYQGLKRLKELMGA
jgi:DNA-directed RNA polymerase specialized sigma24 family protein